MTVHPVRDPVGVTVGVGVGDAVAVGGEVAVAGTVVAVGTGGDVDVGEAAGREAVDPLARVGGCHSPDHP